MFRRQGLIFTKRSCFVLTPTGVEFARTVSEAAEKTAMQEGERHAVDASTSSASIYYGRPKPAPGLPSLPRWDGDYREIRFGDKIVKQFKLPSPNQEAILLAFHEKGWPPRIEDPLPPNANFDTKQRLHDAIRGLNRNQKNRLLRFKGDGTGVGI